MQIAFLIIISLLAASYAFWTKQTKIAGGILILTLSFVLQIPDMVNGFWVDLLLALSLILFALGLLTIIWKKKEAEEKAEDSEIEKQ